MAGRRLLYISTVWPEHRSSAAGVRTCQLLKAFQAKGWVPACGSIARTTPYRGELEASGIATYNCRVNTSDVEEAVKSFRPDVVMFERFNVEEMFGWQVREADASIVRMVDTQDVHTLRYEREALLKQNPQASLREIVDVDIGVESSVLLRELGAIHRCDAALLVSDFERHMLIHKYGVTGSKLQLAPFFYEAPPDEDALPEFDRVGDFAFIGNFRHAPNADAVHWAADSLWPKLRQRLTHPSAPSNGPDQQSITPGSRGPAAVTWPDRGKRRRAPGMGPPEFHIYGAYPRKADMDLTDHHTGFVVKGPTPDQYKALSRYRVLLAPLRVGAGVKGKIADAWWCGLPVVTTPIGAEGMGWTNTGGGKGGSWGGLVGWDEEEIIEAAARLYQDRTLWEACRQRGRALLTERFGHKAAEDVVDFTEALVRDIKDRRRRDVVQAMLWTTQHRATEYMARFLQAKGQLKQIEQRSQPPTP